MRTAAALIADIGLKSWVDEYWAKNPPISTPSLRRSPDIYGFYREMLLANDEQGYIRTCLAIADATDLTPQLHAVQIPVLVIGGALDDRTPLEASRKLADLLPTASLVELHDTGHTMQLEAPAGSPRPLSTSLIRLADASSNP